MSQSQREPDTWRSLYRILALGFFTVNEVPFVHLKYWIFNIPLLFISSSTQPTVQFTYKYPLASTCHGKGGAGARCVPYRWPSCQAEDKLPGLSFLSMHTFSTEQVHRYVAFTFWNKQVHLACTFCHGDRISYKSNLRQFRMSSCPVKSRYQEKLRKFNPK